MSTTERAQSDFKKLKSKYNSQLSTLKELFTEWTEEDLLFTLQDADGDLELAIDRISEGHASQWGEVKTKKSKKEAAAANKATLEVSASSTTSTAPSYPSSSSYNNNTRAPSNRTSTNAKRLSPAVSQPRHKPTSATWQQQPTKKTTDDNNNWKSTDNWSSNDSWSTQTKDPIVETPKKISTPSSSTKTSNGGGAKTWASLLQSKPEPVVVAEPIEEPQLRKVDDSWLPSSSDLNQWDQPLQLPTTENFKSSYTGQQYPQQNMYGQPPQQSFYPYYYMPNQFNAYSPYGQQGANSFVNNTRNNMYPTSVYGQQKTTTPSPYLNSSPYNQSQQLYSGFNQFDQFYNNSPQAAATTVAAESPDKTNVTKSPQNPSQQAYRNTNQYWNQ
ncbi:hypothetical protein INT48_008045 [Thamnidium elegans]|uniref:RNA polymerase II degradation factor 1 n=1 Tax=Thamnidium elegans TaxID=101142 RepID=A0A8H7SPI6_9FUNG|nr:hypothetical protein INT48_008045 [Thamnidium elegans]